MSISGNTLYLTYGEVNDAEVVAYLTGRDNPIIILGENATAVIARKQDWFRLVWIMGDQVKVYESVKGWYSYSLDTNAKVRRGGGSSESAEFIVHIHAIPHGSETVWEVDESVEDFAEAVLAGKTIKICRFDSLSPSRSASVYVCDEAICSYHPQYGYSGSASCSCFEFEAPNEIIFYALGVIINSYANKLTYFSAIKDVLVTLNEND